MLAPSEGPVVPFPESSNLEEQIETRNHDQDLQIFNQVRQITQVKFVENDLEYSKIHHVLDTNKHRVVVPVSFFQSITADFSQRLLNDPFTYLPPAEAALGDVARSVLSLGTKSGPAAGTGSFVSIKDRETKYQLRIGLSGWFGSHGVTPRGLNSRLANKIVCIEGVVTRCSVVRPDLTHGTFYVPELQRHFFRETTDTVGISAKTSLMGRVRGEAISRITKDSEGRSVELEHGLSFYRDLQRVTIQEMPEVTPTGQLPRSVDAIFESDLVDTLKPGDRCRVYGVLRVSVMKEPNATGPGISGLSKMFLVANNAELLPYGTRCITSLDALTPVVIQQFKDLAASKDTLKIVAASVAPSISGHEMVKRGLALQLVGGQAKTVQGDGTSLRGNIHILLVGDPSCGKSQMLRFVVNASPLALSTTGRGSSAVGLTAAVVSDQDTGERRLEAGAMVLGDGGLVCIDEFDKMSADDRIAVHEVMEQQRVSINKAGISAVLNARTSVLAAANPIYGLFDDRIEFSKQINFPDSLLSRFDLIYLIRESNTAEMDRRIAGQVLAQLRVPATDSLQEGMNARSNVESRESCFTLQPLTEVPTDQRTGKAVMWTKPPSQLLTQNSRSTAERILTADFLTQYMQYCKSQPDAELTEEACEDIAEFYGRIRERLQQGKIHTSASTSRRATHAKAIPTPRLLEACIRLATAHARLKLKTKIDSTDVKEAIKLLRYTLCGEVEEDEAAPATKKGKRVASRRAPPRTPEENLAVEIENMAIVDIPDQQPKKRRKTAAIEEAVPAEIIDSLTEIIGSLASSQEEQDWESDVLVKLVNKSLKKQKADKIENDQFQSALKVLQRSNKIMLVGTRVYWI